MNILSKTFSYLVLSLFLNNVIFVKSSSNPSLKSKPKFEDDPTIQLDPVVIKDNAFDKDIDRIINDTIFSRDLVKEFNTEDKQIALIKHVFFLAENGIKMGDTNSLSYFALERVLKHIRDKFQYQKNYSTHFYWTTRRVFERKPQKSAEEYEKELNAMLVELKIINSYLFMAKKCLEHLYKSR